MADVPETTFFLSSNIYTIKLHKFWLFLFFWDLNPEAIKKFKFVDRIMKMCCCSLVESFKEDRILISLYSNFKYCSMCHYITLLCKDLIIQILDKPCFLSNFPKQHLHDPLKARCRPEILRHFTILLHHIDLFNISLL